MGRAHARATALAVASSSILLLLRAAVGCALITGVDQLAETDSPGDASPPLDEPASDTREAEEPAPERTEMETTLDAPFDDGPPNSLADADAPSCPGCVCATFTDPLDADASLPNWSKLGVARLRGSYAELTPDARDSAGGLWWTSAAPMPLTSFDATFQLSLTFAPLDASSAPADGIAFAWLASATLPPACMPGDSLCVMGQGIAGDAMIVRTYHTVMTEPPVPYVAIVDANAFPLAPPAPGTFVSIAMSGIPTQLASVNDNAPPPVPTWHLFRVRSTHGKADVWLDGTQILTQVPLPSPAPTAGYWGFGAGTGGSATRHAVRNVTMTLLDPACP
jgi:hypothetical protein